MSAWSSGSSPASMATRGQVWPGGEGRTREAPAAFAVPRALSEALPTTPPPRALHQLPANLADLFSSFLTIEKYLETNAKYCQDSTYYLNNFCSSLEY